MSARKNLLAQLERWVREERSDQEIGDLLGLSARQVRRRRHALGVLRAPTPARPVPDAELQDLWSRGLTNQEISQESGLTVRSVQERLHRLSLPSHRE